LRLPELTVHEPADLESAWQLLRDLGPEARLMAGGTDLLVDLKTGRASTPAIISLGRIRSLAGIERDRGGTGRGLRIGALTTIAELERAAQLTGPYAIIREAAREMAAPQVRNLATVGGNLASAVPCADLPPVLGVLDASIVLSSAGSARVMPLLDFFAGPRQTFREPQEILTAVLVPAPPPRFGAAYARLALREGNAIAVASVGAALSLDDEGAITRARIMLGAVAPIPRRADEAALALVGGTLAGGLEQAVAQAMRAASPISDIRGSAAYRREMVGVLTRRALITAQARAQEALP
jgi:CO/xanthine dehydrogenase FAD-binding subunit